MMRVEPQVASWNVEHTNSWLRIGGDNHPRNGLHILQLAGRNSGTGLWHDQERGVWHSCGTQSAKDSTMEMGNRLISGQYYTVGADIMDRPGTYQHDFHIPLIAQDANCRAVAGSLQHVAHVGTCPLPPLLLRACQAIFHLQIYSQDMSGTARQPQVKLYGHPPVITQTRL